MGTYLVDHDVLRHYLHSFRVVGGGVVMPHILWRTHFKAHGVKFRKTVAMHHSQSWWHGRFNCAWYAYVDLLDIGYSDGFNCSICKHEVDVVICDGTPLSFRRKFLITAPKEETKKHMKHCKVTPMQKDVYWPQHAGDFCRGTQEVARAQKGSCCPMNLIQCYLSWDTECQASLIQEDDDGE